MARKLIDFCIELNKGELKMIEEYHIKKKDICYTDYAISLNTIGIPFDVMDNMEFAKDCGGQYIGIYATNEDQVLGLYKFYIDDFARNQDYYFKLYTKFRFYFIRSISKCIMG